MGGSLANVLKESRFFGIVVMTDGATIDLRALYNIIAASPNNPMSILDIINLSASSAKGQKKTGSFLADLMTPSMKKLENETDNYGRDHRGVIDLVAMDGASNVQKAGEILSVRFPKITVVHGVEHCTDLVFSDAYTGVDEFKYLASLTRKARNVLCSTRHAPSPMFRVEAKIHNDGIAVNLLKRSECR